MNTQSSMEELSGDLSRIVRERKDAVLCIAAEGGGARTGFAIGNGEILSVARQADDGETVPLILPDGAEVSATVTGFDSMTGLVLLRTDGESGPGMPDVRTEPPAVGELTVTVACPSPDGLEARLGMIRFVSRALAAAGEGDLFFQTDASLFPGFAGAPVFDAEGKLLGITALAGHAESAYVIPAELAMETARTLREHGSPRAAYLGIRTAVAEFPPGAGGEDPDRPADETATGLVVVAIEEGSPAMQAGILPGDIIVSIADRRIRDHADLLQLLSGLGEGEAAAVEIIRGGKRERLSITPGFRQDSAWRQSRGRHGAGRHRGYGCGR